MSERSTQPAGAARPAGLPFSGLKVLDISQGISGPYCAHVLWQQGAEVIKVEPPAGDWSRALGVVHEDLSSLTVAFNGGKRGVCVDATREEGRRIVRRLAADADVIVQNFRPGIAARLGLDPSQMRAERPELIYVSISGYGADGPYADAPATDSVVQADAGLMFANRGPEYAPRKFGVYIADVNAGLFGAQAVAAALYRRAMGGPGEHIEVNLFDTCAATLVCNYVEHGMAPQRESMPVLPPSVPNGTFAAADGVVNLLTLNDAQFVRLCEALGAPHWAQDPRFRDEASRGANMAEMNALIADVIGRESVEHWTRQLRKHDILNAPVRTLSQCIEHPAAKHLGTFQPLEQPGLGTLMWPGIPVRAFRRPIEAAPHIGQHTDEVLERAGFSREEREKLYGSGVTVQFGAG